MPSPFVVPPLAQRLKTETAQHHRETEDVLIPVLHNLQSASGYAAVLKTMYGFHTPLEALIAKHITPALLPDVAQRRRSALALHDLAALGETGTPVPCDALPAIETAADAFGVLYVLEGSALGGKYIANMLAKNTALALPANALRFFQGYGPQTGALWATLLSTVDGQSANGDAVVKAAAETFVRLKQWMQETLIYEPAQ